ncbi:FAD-dependent oxidoreductase [Acidaminobacter hydrogenoformans]|uniref:CxxC motif-containing protein n=1 Tax=Acidaminobacter hydrogenoformans DSM 2784 TaxID=1120920 RepID=A0A1G5RXT9_9FIRM|nr:FAD-dependent oxidoreductase [Acidaminobacter hydrogenoformans]SCZ78934.1 CxxC motif-containing protein [Acidaminobacter hydrogenoformans DSM 2784]
MKTKAQSGVEKRSPDLLVIGAGPAGLSAATEAKRCGVGHVLVVDREREAGGILNQCVHTGFGLFHYGEALTGPEYAQRLVAEAEAAGVAFMMETFAASLDQERNVILYSKEDGYEKLSPMAVILAMGCRERTRAAVAVPGSRPAGVYAAGTAQRLINIEGYALGKRAVIVGSGDIGLIMARRLVLEGVEVAAVIEIRETPAGLPRNVSQCLNAFSIPLFLAHRVIAIEGVSRVSSVVIAPVNGGESLRISCDLVLFSVGLIPENELSAMAGIQTLGRTNGLVLDGRMQTEVPGIFACGNAYRVYDLVDEVSREAALAGRYAAAFLGCHAEGRESCKSPFESKKLESPCRKAEFSVSDTEANCRAASPIICIICPKSCRMTVDEKGEPTGYGCRRGYEYALQELQDPSAVLTTTVAVRDALWPRLPCKTTAPVPRDKLREAAQALSEIEVQAPVALGEILCRDLLGLGVDVIATRCLNKVDKL